MSAKFIKIEAYIYSHFSVKLTQCRKMRRVEHTDIFSTNLDRKQNICFKKYFINKLLLGVTWAPQAAQW